MPRSMAHCAADASTRLPKRIGTPPCRSMSKAFGIAARRWCRRCGKPEAAASSISPRLPRPTACRRSRHYTTSKAAVIGLTRGLARELGRDGIRVNALAPSAVLTDGTREFFGDKADRALEVIKTGQSIQRNLTPSDLVGAVIWLVSDASRFVTGQTIAIDGGTVML